MTRITKVTEVMITMIAKIRITVAITGRKSNNIINNENNTATQVTFKTEKISNRKH